MRTEYTPPGLSRGFPETPLPKRTRLAQLRRLSTRGMSCAAEPAEHCSLAIDGDSRSFWTTREPQSGRHFFRLLFARSLRLRGVGLEMGLSGLNYPRSAVLYGLTSAGWMRLTYRFKAVGFLRDLLDTPRTATMEFVLSPVRLRGLEVRVEHQFAAHKPWRLPEIHVYE